MFGSSVILCVLCFVISGQCDMIAFEPGQTYSWIIPPRQSPPSGDAIDTRNESPLAPVGGYGHPQYRVRHSNEQLHLPNEFLITPLNPNPNSNGNPIDERIDVGGNGGLVLSHPPIFQQIDPVDCNGDPTCPSVDISPVQQQHATAVGRVPGQGTVAPTSLSSQPNYQTQQQHPSIGISGPVSWPSSNGGGIGLLFFAPPQSASHLPVEELIRQQLMLHRTQLPFDISVNCEDTVGVGVGSTTGYHHRPLPLSFLPAEQSSSLWNGRNAPENSNYAGSFEIVNGSIRRRGSQEWQQQQQYQQMVPRRWRTIRERILRNKHQQNRPGEEQQQEQPGLS